MSTDWRRAIETQREGKTGTSATIRTRRSRTRNASRSTASSTTRSTRDYRFELPLDEYDDPERVTVGTHGRRAKSTCAGASSALPSAARTSRSRPTNRTRTTNGSGSRSGRDQRRRDLRRRSVPRPLEYDSHRTNDGNWVLDFNRAYNPTCAYSDRYECPLPPTENWLEVPIEAGEQAFH